MSRPPVRIIAGLLCLTVLCRPLAAVEAGEVLYLANEGVLVRSGPIKVLFDPLFDTDYGQYQRVPADMQAAMMAGAPPFDGVDAVFVSHAHGDHFAASPMLAFLVAHTDTRMYGPMQAIAALREAAAGNHQDVFDRVTGLSLEVGEEPASLRLDNLVVDAVRIPHSGWPDRMTDIENLAFRVTLGEAVTVLHLGDADPNPRHFRAYGEHRESRDVDVAMVPYWFFLSRGGLAVLDTQLRPVQAIGVHVPRAMPDDPAARPAGLRGHDLFTEPGETRDIMTAD